MIRTGRRRREPAINVPVRQYVSLYPECRDKEVVNNVLRNQGHFDWTSAGDVQRIDFALATRMLELPHPLLAHAIDYQGVLGRVLNVIVEYRAPDKNDHGDTERDDGPHNFQQGGTVDLLRFLTRTSTVPDNKEEDQQGDEQGEERGDQHQKQVERIYLPRYC